MLLFVFNKKKVILSIVIGSIALVGDKNSEGQENPLVAAVCDNVTHGLIGALTWMTMFIVNNSHPNLGFFVEIILCGFFSSALDLDHFIAAKSFHLKDAVNLKSRPFMHCTTLILFMVTFLISVSTIFKLRSLFKFGWILVASLLSHHIRDGKRRGLWLWPFGSTLPIPFFLYLLIQMLLPHIFLFILSKTDPFDITKQSHRYVYAV